MILQNKLSRACQAFSTSVASLAIILTKDALLINELIILATAQTLRGIGLAAGKTGTRALHTSLLVVHQTGRIVTGTGTQTLALV